MILLKSVGWRYEITERNGIGPPISTRNWTPKRPVLRLLDSGRSSDDPAVAEVRAAMAGRRRYDARAAATVLGRRSNLSTAEARAQINEAIGAPASPLRLAVWRPSADQWSAPGWTCREWAGMWPSSSHQRLAAVEVWVDLSGQTGEPSWLVIRKERDQ